MSGGATTSFGQQVFPGHFNTAVRLQIVLDPINAVAFGRADFDSNGIFEVETTHFALDPTGFQSLAAGTHFALDPRTGFQSLAGVEVMQDWRSPLTHAGAEFDNIVLEADPTTTVPEPTTLALLGLGLAGIGWRKRLH